MASGLLTGEAVPEAVLSELGIVGQRAVVAFYCRDSGFEDRKQLQDFQDRAAAFEKLACEIVAVRGNKRDAAVDGMEAKHHKFPGSVTLRVFGIIHVHVNLVKPSRLRHGCDVTCA